MAAVDVDVNEGKRVAKVRKADARGLGSKDGPGSRWRGGEEKRVRVHEQLVCSIKAHQNGTLEIAPGKHVVSALDKRQQTEKV